MTQRPHCYLLAVMILLSLICHHIQASLLHSRRHLLTDTAAAAVTVVVTTAASSLAVANLPFIQFYQKQAQSPHKQAPFAK